MSQIPKDTELVIIHLVFDASTVTLKIPRLLFVNYWNKICDVEHSIKMKMFRGEMGLTDAHMVKKSVYRIGESQYISHERIFDSCRLGHPSSDVTVQEYYLQFAVSQWTECKFAGLREPSTIRVTEIFRARADPKVEVLKWRSKGERRKARNGR